MCRSLTAFESFTVSGARRKRVKQLSVGTPHRPSCRSDATTRTRAAQAVADTSAATSRAAGPRAVRSSISNHPSHALTCGGRMCPLALAYEWNAALASARLASYSSAAERISRPASLPSPEQDHSLTSRAGSAWGAEPVGRRCSRRRVTRSRRLQVGEAAPRDWTLTDDSPR